MATPARELETVDVRDDGWRDIEALFSQLRLIAQTPQAPALFYEQWLPVLVEGLALEGGVVWQHMGDQSAQAVCQLRPDLAGLVNNVASQRFHLGMVQAVVSGRRTITAAPQSSVAGQVNPTDRTLIFAPVTYEGRVTHVVEVLAGSATPQSVATLASLLEVATESASEFHRAQQTRNLSDRLTAVDQANEFARQVFARLDLDTTALTIVQEGLRFWQCDRVSLLLVEGAKCRTLAVSGTEQFERRSGLVRALEELGAVIARGGEVVYPASEEYAPQVEAALQNYVDTANCNALRGVPLQRTADEDAERDTPQSAFAILIIEQLQATSPPAHGDDSSALLVHSALALENALLCRRWWWFRWGSRWWGEDALRRSASGQRWKWATGVAIALAVIGLWPVRFNVAASGRLQPAQRQDVFAPLDGFVTQLHVKEGTAVERGAPLLDLYSPALELQLTEVLGKRQATEVALAAARSLRLTNSSDSRQNDPARHAADEEELRVTLDGLKKQYAILQTQRSGLNLKSPLQGEIITRDLARHLQGRPVRAGDLLLRVGDTAGAWELELDLPEYRFAPVEQRGADTPVRFLVTTSPAQSHLGTIKRLGGAAQADEQGRPTVPVVVAVTDPPSDARAGATVQAQIDCGRRPLAYVWFHDAWEAAQRWWH